MKKEFIHYEQALALKELGFDEPFFGYYVELRNPQEGILVIDKCENGIDGVLAPTFSQAFRWFREKYGLVVDWSHEKNYHVGSYIGICVKNINHKEPIFGIYETHEEAELDCLKKLISIVKNK